MPIDLHPLVVHFPIAMVIVVVLFDWGRWIFDRDGLLAGGFWSGSTPLLIVGLLGAIGSAISGLIAEEGVEANAVVRQLIDAHETLAFVTVGLLALLTFWRIGLKGRFPGKARFIYLVLLIAVAVVIGYGAYFGGLMVHAHAVGVDVP